jgi:flagellar motor protein MotB
MKRTGKRAAKRDDNLWLISYSDLITSILAVLVLVTSFSKIDLEKIDHANRLMHDDSLVTLAMLQRQYEKLVRREALQKYVEIGLDEEGLRIRMASTIQFDVNSAKIDRERIKILAPLLSKIVEDSKRREIIIIGHTDRTGSPERNWELASQRANAVMLYLMELGLDYRHSHIVAYGSNKPYRAQCDDEAVSKAEKMARDRRVTILIGRTH